MKTRTMLAVTAIAAALAGCDTQNVDEAQSSSTPAAQGQDSSESPGEALTTMKEKAADTKDAFVATMEQRLQELDAKIATLGNRLKQAQGEALAKEKDAFATLHEKRAQLGRKYDELKAAGQDAWQSLKEGVSSAMNEVEQGYEDIMQRLES